uniref:Uncharacterized protein n=1 Tax=Avena sativa TaxID=4498 RepID=A0ACD5UL64_AVESA
MSSSMSILLHWSLLLLLVFVQPTHSATMEKPRNPSSSNTYIVQTDHLAQPSQFSSLEHWYIAMVTTHSPRATTNSSSIRLLHTYDTVLHGFAVDLTDEEAQRMSRIPGVSGVYKDSVYYTHTTRSPGFIGLHEEFGDGIIIGFVDTGIWPERASFNDSGLGPVRSTWKGNCVDAEGFNASLCNNKLVGAKVFVTEPDGASTPRDKLGHGTHVTATAAGSRARGANLLEFSRGDAWGVAPRARIAVYKACSGWGTCPGWSITAAIDAAVRDGVDVLSLSAGDKPMPFYDDVVAIATFGAERRGVFVVLSGGNSGPNASSVTNVAPWVTTVGAATTDRVFPAKLALGNGDVLTGQSLYNLKAARDGASLASYLSLSRGWREEFYRHTTPPTSARSPTTRSDAPTIRSLRAARTTRTNTQLPPTDRNGLLHAASLHEQVQEHTRTHTWHTRHGNLQPRRTTQPARHAIPTRAQLAQTPASVLNLDMHAGRLRERGLFLTARTSAIPLVRSSCGVDDLTPEKVMGKVVVCSDSEMTGTGMSIIPRAGGAGIVLVQSAERFRDAVRAQTFRLPGLVLGYSAGKKLDAYISSVPYPVASFSFSCDTVTGENRAPMVAGFSSRGPSSIVPEILKPDVVAPGVNILAAWTGEAQPSRSEIDARAEYNIISGTSMACPHVAGVAALIKRRHGDWTPAMPRRRRRR